MPDDPVTWKLIAGSAITALAAPVLYVARKAVSSVSRAELVSAIENQDKSHEKLVNEVVAVRSEVAGLRTDFSKQLSEHIQEENGALDALLDHFGIKRK